MDVLAVARSVLLLFPGLMPSGFTGPSPPGSSALPVKDVTSSVIMDVIMDVTWM